jgi:hypothetical protein
LVVENRDDEWNDEKRRDEIEYNRVDLLDDSDDNYIVKLKKK